MIKVRLIFLAITIAQMFVSHASADDAKQARLRATYEEYVALFESDYPKHMAQANEAARSRNKFAADTEKIGREFFQTIDYQKIIDRMVCVETEPSGVEECDARRRQSSMEMWKFWTEYSSSPPGSEVHRACEMKSRLLVYEVRYAPMKYLVTGRDERSPPRAYDAKLYMECVRAKL